MVDDDCSYEFAFELNPEDSYKKTNNVLPFGCHGWSRFGRDFWKSYIEAFGYTVNYISQDDELSYLSEGKSRREKLLKYYDTQLLVKALFELIPGFKGELYVFGAGVFGLSFLNMIKETGIKVCGIIDNDPYKIGRTIMGIKVIALSDIIGNIMHPIIIAVSNALPISEQLSLIGLKPRVDYITSKEIQEKMMSGKKNE